METRSSKNLKHYGVVVVEDSKSDARLIVEGLSQDGRKLSIMILTDGEKASRHFSSPGDLPALAGMEPDLILLDLNLPKKTGSELIGEIRAIPGLRNVPLVVFSGSCQKDEVWRCYDLGATLVVPKPLDVEPFISAVKAIEHYCLDVVGPSAGAGHL
jgi:two-component system, chemotaxis family, response regulator Rcp1